MSEMAIAACSECRTGKHGSMLQDGRCACCYTVLMVPVARVEEAGKPYEELLDWITDVLYPEDEEPESDWDAPGICEALAERLKVDRPEAWKRQVYRCEVAITNIYNGVEKVSYHLVPEPDGEPTDEWWEEHVWPITGTGEPDDRDAITSGYFGEIVQSHNSLIQGSEHEWV